MARYIDNTPNDVYNNGTLFRFNEDEWKFITENQNNPSANRIPSMMNIYGSTTQSIPSNADRPFKTVMPVINNGQIVGFQWKTPIIGTNGPSDPANPNRAAITEETTKKIIEMANRGEIDKREAMFIVRARVGMENADVPIFKPGSKNEDLYREDARHPTDNSGGYSQYGGGGKTPDISKKNSTNFDSLRDQIYNQDNSRKILERINQFSRELAKELNPPNKNGSIRETFDVNGMPRYIKRPQSGQTTINRWTLFTPEVGDILERIPISSRPYVMDDLNHLVSTNIVRNQNENDKRSRSSGPKLDLFNFGITSDPKYKGKPHINDITYEGLKAGRSGIYSSIVGAFAVMWLLRHFKKLDVRSTHKILEYIEWASVGFKSTKNLAKASSNYGVLWDQISPIYSVIAPYAWYQFGHWLGGALTARLGAAAIWSGPFVTLCIIGLEISVELIKKKYIEQKRQDALRELAKKNGWLEQIFVDSDGNVKIPILDNREYPDMEAYDNLPDTDATRTKPRSRIQKARIPIGIKKDKDGNPIHLKYKDLPPPAGGWPIPEADVPVFDANGMPIPGSWVPVLIYSSEPIALVGESANEPGIHSGLGFYTDTDEAIINTNICLNALSIENGNREERYKQISSINARNGFGVLSDSDNLPYTPPEIPTDPTEAPYSDDLSWSQLENLKDIYGTDEIVTIEYVKYSPKEIDPTSNKRGMPSTSPTMIPNGNADQIVIPPGPYGPGGIIG